jgi:hypothetical protein
MEITLFDPLKPKKRLFVGLLTASMLVLVGLMGLMWYLFTHRGFLLEKSLLYLLLGVIITFLLVVGFGICGVIITLWQARTVPGLQNFMRVAINLLFPLAVPLGQVVGFSKAKIRSSFIEVNNQLVRSEKITCQASEILVLAPHCLQMNDCIHKITANIHNCQHCGGCSVDRLLGLEAQYGVKVAVATGGTLARKFISEYQPRAVVAIACERDLTSGIQDSNPLPVLGVFNSRPHGPCKDTWVDEQRVKKAIEFFLGAQ